MTPTFYSRPPIACLVLTLNEERNIARCLDSVKWCDDVLVLDSGSRDRTVPIARAHGVRVMEQPWLGFAAQRNWGLEHGGIKAEWVLHLDADEEVPDTLRRELGKVAGRGAHTAYRVPSKTMFMGRWLRHAGLYPSYQVRFGRRDELRFEQVGHGQRESLPADDVGTLENPLVHHAFSKGFEDWFHRHNRYSSDEARRELRLELDLLGEIAMLTRGRGASEKRRALKNLASRMPLRPLLRFLYMFGAKGGFLDGREGFVYSALLAWYEYQIVLKKEELIMQEKGLHL